MDDHALLREYLEHHSEPAFAELVQRHLPLVYGTALRLARDPHAAQDIAQAVFIQLARKAWTIREGRALPGWLYRATHHAAYAARRADIRRRERETAAMNLAEQNRDAPGAWAQIAPLLDDALARLNRVEQDAVLLRFFQDQSYREVGVALGLNEDTARKRTERALEKIRLHFSHRGVTTSAALLGSAIAAHAATPPPVGLAANVSSASLGSFATAGVGGMVAAVRKIFFMTTKTKVILAAVLIAVLALISLMLHWQKGDESSRPPASETDVNPAVGSLPSQSALAMSSTLHNAVAAPALPPVSASQSNAPIPRGTLGTTQVKQTVTNNLQLLATAANNYMLDKAVPAATYTDFVNNTTDTYLPSITPVVGEDYSSMVFHINETQVSIVLPDGTNVTYNVDSATAQ